LYIAAKNQNLFEGADSVVLQKVLR